jgi:archaellum component FlaC
MIFSGGSGGIKREVQGLQSEVGDLRKEVGDLRKAVESQSTEIRQLLDRLPPEVQSEGEAGK